MYLLCNSVYENLMAKVMYVSGPIIPSVCVLPGKHPVSALQELCARKRWEPPRYDLKHDAGPAHLKLFLYQVHMSMYINLAVVFVTHFAC